MNSGALRHSIELQSATNTSDGMGGVTSTWATVSGGTVRAAIWPTSAKEQKQGAAPTMTVTHTIRIRYYDGLLASWRVKFGTRYFSIVSIVNKDERGVQTDLLCNEVVA